MAIAFKRMAVWPFTVKRTDAVVHDFTDRRLCGTGPDHVGAFNAFFHPFVARRVEFGAFSGLAHGALAGEDDLHVRIGVAAGRRWIGNHDEPQEFVDHFASLRCRVAWRGVCFQVESACG